MERVYKIIVLNILVIVMVAGCSEKNGSSIQDEVTMLESKIIDMKAEIDANEAEKTDLLKMVDDIVIEHNNEIDLLDEKHKEEKLQISKTNDEVKKELDEKNQLLYDLQSNLINKVNFNFNSKMEMIEQEDVEVERVIKNGDAMNLQVPDYKRSEPIVYEEIDMNLKLLNEVDVTADKLRIIGFVDENPLILIGNETDCIVTIKEDDELILKYAIKFDEHFGFSYVFNIVETESMIYVALSTDMLKISKDTGEIIEHRRFSTDFPGEELVVSNDGKHVCFIVPEEGMFITNSEFNKGYIQILSYEDETYGMEGSSMARYPVFNSIDSSKVLIKNLGYEWSYGVYEVNIFSGEIRGVLGPDYSAFYSVGDLLYFSEYFSLETQVLNIKDNTIAVLDWKPTDFGVYSKTDKYVTNRAIGNASTDDNKINLEILSLEDQVIYDSGLKAIYRLQAMKDNLLYLSYWSYGTKVNVYEVVNSD